MVKTLIAEQIETKRCEVPYITVFDIVIYHLKRNAKAYRYHRERTFESLKSVATIFEDEVAL